MGIHLKNLEDLQEFYHKTENLRSVLAFRTEFGVLRLEQARFYVMPGSLEQ